MFLPNECPGLCQHRPGHSLGKNVKLHEMKKEKATLGFRIHKIWQILKRFAGTFRQVQILKLGRVPVHEFKRLRPHSFSAFG